MGAEEFFLEPCSGTCEAESHMGSTMLNVRLMSSQHFMVNVTSALVDAVESIGEMVTLQVRVCCIVCSL